METSSKTTNKIKNDESKISRVHFIGIGGVGMSGIASVACSLGIAVTGSDLKESKYSKSLRSQGIEVWIGHSAANIDKSNPDVAVVSSAIPDSNPELVRAKELGIEIWPRAKMLALVCEQFKVIAVAGTHGKTTTSSMLASALVELNADPSFLVGGIIDDFDSNARFGSGEYCAIEADESDGSFTYLNPYIAIVTNIEADHLDHYLGGIGEIYTAFADFVSSIPPDGLLVACGDSDEAAKLLRSSCKAPLVLYGLSEKCDVCLKAHEDGSFTITMPDGRTATGKLSHSPGIHNMLNAASVLVVLDHIGFPLDKAMQAISSFKGVRRRFDLVGKVAGVTIVDDYGHHPTEIAATLAAASNMGFSRIHVLFQPHRYSRTKALAKEFAKAFDLADIVTVMDVYSAGETPIPGVTGKTIVDSVLAHDSKKKISWISRRDDIIDSLAKSLNPGDLLITMGAGDVTAIGPLVLERLEAQES